MKICLDIPDETLIASFVYACSEKPKTNSGLKWFGSVNIAGDELKDGAEIKIRPGVNHESE